MWVLVTPDMKWYLYREGYVRTSSTRYSCDQFENELIHLTNNAVQKNGALYGAHEDGN